MKNLRWQLIVVLLALAAIATLLLSQQQALVPQAIEPTPQPAVGGIYSEALIGSFGRLNPLLDFYNPVDHDINRLIYSGLIRFDDRGSPTGDLADSWGISQDGSVYNFSIRPNAVWHDGAPVTTDDVIFTVDLLRNPELPIPVDLREFWDQVEILPINEKTVQFRLPEAFSPFLDYMTFGVLPQHLLSNLVPAELVGAPYNMQPVGSGPYRFERLLVEDGKIQGVALSANELYYRQSPFLEQIIFKYYPDAAAAFAAYQQGDVMGIGQVTGDILQGVLKEPGLQVYSGRQPRITLVYLNLQNQEVPFFQDPVVRRSLLMGINRQGIIDRLLGGQAILADGPILPGSWAFYDGIERIGYDSDTALAQIKKAGYTIPAEGGSVRAKDGVLLEFELIHPDQAPYPAIAAAIQSNWERLGVKANLKSVPYADLVSDYLDSRSYEAALVDLNMARSPDPDPYPFWHQEQISGGQNYSQWDDRQVSEYLEQARVLVDFSERTKRYRNFQVRFTTEMPSLPLYYSVFTCAVGTQVKGVSVGPLYDPSDRFNTITGWYMLAGPENEPLPTDPTTTP